MMQGFLASARRLAGPAMLVLAVLPSVALAQRGGGAGPRGPGGNPVAPLIEMRRELNLSSRQLVQLDSIERSLLQENRAIQSQLRSRMDSAGPRRMDRSLTEEQRTQMREQMRARMDSLRPLRQQLTRNDSLARTRAMAVLTDSQRVRVREWQAERRGFERGRMSIRRGADRPRAGFRGAPGARARPNPPARRPPMGEGFREARPSPRRLPGGEPPRQGR
jgi:hypothetical protein